MEFFRRLFEAADFMPHGHCYRWEPAILWLHVGSDAVIALSYYSIPIALIYFVSRRSDLEFGWVFWMFAGFILMCGTSHVVEIYTTWTPVYRAEGVVKAITAGVSVATAIAMWPLLPKALALPSREELELKNAALREHVNELELFARATAHDLREPVRMVGSYAQILDEEYRGRVDEQADHYVDFVVEGARRTAETLDALLAYSEVGRTLMRVETVDLNDVIARVRSKLAQTIVAQSAVLDVSPLPTLRCDRALVGVVFEHLISNALQFAGRGARIEVSATKQDERSWMVVVSDDGPGIPPSEATNVFGPFARLHERDEHPGMGIGLSISRRIIERLGGRIWIDPKAKQGVRVCFTLPAARSIDA